MDQSNLDTVNKLLAKALSTDSKPERDSALVMIGDRLVQDGLSHSDVALIAKETFDGNIFTSMRRNFDRERKWLRAEIEELRLLLGHDTARLFKLRDKAERSEPQGGYRKRIKATVMSYLRDPEASMMSDRAIAKNAGVSPQTVGNWRRRMMDSARSAERREARPRRLRLPLRTAPYKQQIVAPRYIDLVAPAAGFSNRHYSSTCPWTVLSRAYAHGFREERSAHEERNKITCLP